MKTVLTIYYATASPHLFARRADSPVPKQVGGPLMCKAPRGKYNLSTLSTSNTKQHKKSCKSCHFVNVMLRYAIDFFYSKQNKHAIILKPEVNQDVVISRKRCILDTKLLWDGNRKPYASYRMVSLSMTLSDP